MPVSCDWFMPWKLGQLEPWHGFVGLWRRYCCFSTDFLAWLCWFVEERLLFLCGLPWCSWIHEGSFWLTGFQKICLKPFMKMEDFVLIPFPCVNTARFLKCIPCVQTPSSMFKLTNKSSLGVSSETSLSFCCFLNASFMDSLEQFFDGLHLWIIRLKTLSPMFSWVQCTCVALERR